MGPDQIDHYQVDYTGNLVTVPAGGTASTSARFFAGAKELNLLQSYAASGIPLFDYAIDFGWFWFLTKPIFRILLVLEALLGNFGLAILLFTFCVKLLFFPLANKSYNAMSKMKLLQPEIQKLRERFPDDKARQQQEMMALYKRVGANPLAGCLPIVIQIPVFFSLYKVLFVTIEMRHAPFFGWIHDLSAPDPTSFANLFGLLPFAPPHILMIGAWPLIMGSDDVLAAKAQPAAGRPGASADVHAAAYRFYLHARRLPGGPRHLLGVEQSAQHRPAMDDHAPRGRRLTGSPEECPRIVSGRALRPSATTFFPIFPPRAADTGLVEAGRRLFAAEARFIAGAPSPSALPPEGLPEIAFVGRSNVGKSSLVNALTGRRTLARISNTPGRTRQINFFDLGGRLMLVDLPGYGYAEAPKSAVKSWTSLVRYYLQTRAALRRVCLLIDSRHGIKEVDRPLMRMLDDAGVSYQVVLTKADKVGKGELASVPDQIMAELAPHVAAHPEIHLTSALDRRGIAELRETLANFAFPVEQSR